MEYLYGAVERITFQNSDTGYTVAQLMPRGSSSLICIVGLMPALQPGESVRLKGEWQNHLVHGRQFAVAECKTEMPSDVVSIAKYLGSGLIKGIGPVFAKRIVKCFGVDTLDIIDLSPDKLQIVEGIGKERLKKIKECWDAQKIIRDLMLFLQHYHISPSFAHKIFRRFGSQSIEKIKENPYSLAREVRGIGFKSADQIAQKMGIAVDSPYRLSAGIEYLLQQLSDEGHVCYPLELFLPLAEKALQSSALLVEQQVNQLVQEMRVVLSPVGFGKTQSTFLWQSKLFQSEIGIARELQRLRYSGSHLREIDCAKALAWVQKELTIQLAKEQYSAVFTSLTDKVHIITGGPGTGKSTITKAILQITDKLTPHIILAAPTGRAAKRMSEITGKKASTIHGLLEFSFQEMAFKKNRDSPLECDLLIIDEASMIDTYLMFSLLKAVPDHARLILVGDINQLPSVGPGNVLKDLISSQRIATTSLTEIFRQAAGSQIITNAHAINSGIFPQLETKSGGDFFFIEKQEPEQILTTITELITKRLPAKGLCPFSDIQLLSPMKRGIIGTENLNIVLQKHLGAKQSPLVRLGRSFLPGDKVIQTRNDYQKEVFNGDVGRILSIDNIEQEMLVSFDEKEVVYSFSDIDDLLLAYAISIHKYQGSECPCIVIPVHTTHFKLLYRNLLYTGVTRGKQLVILVGTKKAVGIAVRNDEVKRRYTALQYQLQMKR